MLLRFSMGNAKLDKNIQIFSLPAGHTCPFAFNCKSKARKIDGKIKDGPNTEFRCYAASMESLRHSVRRIRWNNLRLLTKAKTKARMTKLILDSLSQLASWVRIHESGDFFNQEYFDSWIDVAAHRPYTNFYSYTKALPFWVKRLHDIPKNLVLTASYGGTHDYLIDKYNLRYAKVVYSIEEAIELGLEIDHDDSHARTNGPSFALLIHGTQPMGSKASKALYKLRKQGIYGYGKQASKRIPLEIAC